MNYMLQTHDIFTNPVAFLFRDATDEHDDLPLTVRVRSGEYFATLATQLDVISDALPRQSDAERVNLQKLADELLKLQKRYKIVPKS